VDGFYGGGETIAREIALRLDPERFEVVYCITRWRNDPGERWALDELSEAGIRFIGLQRRSRTHSGPWRELLAFAKENPIDVLHSHKVGSNMWAALLSPWLKPGVFIAHEHSWSFEGQPQRRLADRHLIARRADAFIAVSSEDRRKMIEVERIPPDKARWIPNGIREQPPTDRGPAVREELGIGPDVPLVGVVATLRPAKALDVLIRATAALRERMPEAHVIVIGDDVASEAAESVQLKALIAELGVQDSISLIGHRSDVPDVLDAVDVAALSSNHEGSPLSVMEYMEAGKPVAATRVGGVPDLVIHGETGLLAEKRDHVGLARAIEELLRDPERARAMGLAGRERRRAHFTIESTTRHVEDLYLELHARKRGHES
jgi:glycosyltransferase involved in cell wall biosynthesis